PIRARQEENDEERSPDREQPRAGGLLDLERLAHVVELRGRRQLRAHERLEIIERLAEAVAGSEARADRDRAEPVVAVQRARAGNVLELDEDIAGPSTLNRYNRLR